MDDGAEAMMKSVFDRLGLSARAYDRILKVARTIADLEGADRIREEHIYLAYSYRQSDQFRDGG
jgi:magnesium chelatase family protein